MIRALPVMLIATAALATAETSIHFSGLQSISSSGADAMIGGRLEAIRGKPASAARADDAAFMFRQLLRERGYTHAEVTAAIRGPDEILLAVREGPLLHFGSVHIEGAPKEDVKTLSKLFLAPARKQQSADSDRIPFREQDVAAGLALLVLDMQSRGYWLATATEAKRNVMAKSSEIAFDIRVNPGPLHTIGDAEIRLPSGGDAGAARAIARKYATLPATTNNINKLRSEIEQSFSSRGYKNVSISLARRLDRSRFIPLVTIEPGKSYHLGTLTLDGFQRTLPARVRQRFRNLEGKLFDEAAFRKRLRQLLATGAFSGIRMETTPHDNGTLDATLHFTEGEARSWSAGLGASSYDGVIIQGGYSDRNFRGRLLDLSAGLELSARGVLGEVKLTDPWIFGSNALAGVRLFTLIQTNEGYDNFESGVSAEWSLPVTDHYSLSVIGAASLDHLTDNGLPRADLGETVYLHQRVTFNQRLDYRDNPTLPTTGWHLELPLQIGEVSGGTSTTYARGEAIGGWYHPLGEKQSVALGARAGMLYASGRGIDLPINLRFFSGGARSIRSYAEHELGPRAANGYPVGGEAYWTTSAEYIRNLTGSVKGVAFVDAGNLFRHRADFGFGSPQVAAGLGIRLDLPIGPVRLEYGHNMTRSNGGPSGTFHFAIGLAF